MPSVKYVPVYFRGQSRRGAAHDFLHPDGAAELVSTGMADWSPNGKSLVMRKTKGEIKLRDLSCKMPISVAERAIGGCKLAQAMIEAWRWKWAA